MPRLIRTFDAFESANHSFESASRCLPIMKKTPENRQGGNIRRRFWVDRFDSFDGVALLVAVLVLIFAVLLSFLQDRNSIYVFKGIVGPREVTRIPTLDPTPLSRYTNGTKSRLAVLLTETSGAWLSLSHGLKSIGVPFLITTDYRQAVKHSVVMVYPTVSGSVLPAEALKALAAVPHQNGTLIGFNVLG